MKYLKTIFLFFSLAGYISAQDPLSFAIENKTSGKSLGSIALVSGNGVYIAKFEVKAKKENTPTSGGFYDFTEGMNFLTTTSVFNVLDWTGKVETGVWSTDFKKYTHTVTNAAWQLKQYRVKLQQFNSTGNVGDAIVFDWANYSKKEASALYTAEGCTVAKDSTTATKWKTEAKIKFESPSTITSGVFTQASQADSILVLVIDENDNVALQYKYSISWADPATFGINIESQIAAAKNGQFIVPTETVSSNITLKNDKGEELKYSETLTNKVEKVEVWISGPKQAYKHVPNYKQVKLVDAYTLKTVNGFDPSKNKFDITLVDTMNLTPGTYTMLVKAKRKGYGPEVEKYLLKDFQVKQVQPTVNPNESWANQSCKTCHQSLNKHNATEYKQCVVCHNESLTGKEIVHLAHNIHGGKNLTACVTCHANSQGNDIVKKVACYSCHNGTISKVPSATHSNFTDQMCNTCHASGSLSPDKAHEKLVSVEDNPIPVKTYLYQNYPNPFNPITTIKFSVDSRTAVKINVYNLVGKLVSTITNDVYSAGQYEVKFDGSNLASGVYLYQLITPTYKEIRKFVLMK
ncbi:MAG: T9SS type A sorting domain-containing protein [Stygiobacter sp.]